MLRTSAYCLMTAALLGACIDDDVVLAPVDEARVDHSVSQGGHDYAFVHTPLPWQTAQAFCANYDLANGGGYHLVTVDDAAEERFLDGNEIFAQRSPWWIGYSDVDTPGTWAWITGSSTYTHWFLNEPTTFGHCAVDRRDNNDTWGSKPCDRAYAFICERDGAASTSKGTFSYSAVNTDSAHTNTTVVAVTLYAGQILSAGTCGLPGAALISGDTWIRIKRDGVELGTNDSSYQCGLASLLSVAATTAGVYEIHAGCIRNTPCTGIVAFQY